MSEFEVETHQNIKRFSCLECAKRFYEELKEEKKYLKDNYKDVILKNTYGWKNE